MGLSPAPIPHWEHWSCPDAEIYLTGIDYYEQPRQCRLRLRELYPQLGLSIRQRGDVHLEDCGALLRRLTGAKEADPSSFNPD